MSKSSDKAALSEPRSWTGQWWLPDNIDDKVPGVLSYEPGEGMRLDLIGGWQPRDVLVEDGVLSRTITGSGAEWPIIHGVGDNELVTLLDSFGGGTYRLGGVMLGAFGVPSKTRVVTNGIVVGCHLETADEAAFEAAEVTVENLTWWTRRSGVTGKVFPSKDAKYLGKIKMKRLPAVDVKVDDLRVKLSTLPWPPHQEVKRSYQLTRAKEHVSITFSTADLRPMSYWLEQMSGIRDLISLSMLTPCANLTTRVYVPPTPERYPEDHPLRNQRNEVIVYRREIVTPSADDLDVDMRDFLFTMADLDFEQVMPRWLAMRRQFSTAIGVVLGLRYVTDGYLETRVISAVAAAEAFHRALDPPNPMSNGQHRKLKKAMRAAVPEEHRPFVSDRMPRNEPTLMERLVDLYDRVGEPAKRLIPNAKAWATAAKDARNKLAHMGGSDSHTNAQLSAVAEVTAALVILNLLTEIGLPSDRIASAISGHRALRYAAGLASDHFGQSAEDGASS